MKPARMLGLCVFIVCSTHGVEAQDLSHYRDFKLGSDLASVSTAAGVAASEAKTIHQRPAVLEDLEYRPSHWAAGSNATSDDPVEQIAFSFCEDQLFRIVVDYRHNRGKSTAETRFIRADSLEILFR